MASLGTGLARIESKISDNSTLSDSSNVGIIDVIGITQKGRERTPTIVRSWIEYQRHFGNLVSYSDFPTHCKLALDAGATLRITRLAHYNEPTDSNSFDGSRSYGYLYVGFGAAYGGIWFSSISFGSWANGYTVKIRKAVSRLVNAVDVLVYDHVGNEIDNLHDVNDGLTPFDISAFNERSQYVQIEIAHGNLSYFRNRNGFTRETVLEGGYEDYSRVTASDLIGNATAKTGLYALPSTAKKIALFEQIGNVIELHNGYVEYANNRFCEIYLPTPMFLTAKVATDFRLRENRYSGTEVPNSYKAQLYYGDLLIQDPLTGSKRYIHCISKVAANISQRDNRAKNEFAPFAGSEFPLKGVLGIYYNVLDEANRLDANALVNAGVTPVGIDTDCVIWGNNTLYLPNTLQKKTNIAQTILYLQRECTAIAKRYLLSRPNDMETWMQIYRDNLQILEGVQKARGVYSYRYEGDLNAKTVQDVTFNNPMEIAKGIYRFKIEIKPTPLVEYIGFEIGVSIEGINR